jgi:hypothetical protein
MVLLVQRLIAIAASRLELAGALQGTCRQRPTHTPILRLLRQLRRRHISIDRNTSARPCVDTR